MNLAYKSILEIKALLESGAVSNTQVWDFFLARAKNLDPQIQAFNQFHDDGFNNTPGKLA